MSALVDKFLHLLQITHPYGAVSSLNNQVLLRLLLSMTPSHVLLFLSFCSGVIGSGLAIFSKHGIHDTFLYRYSLNGYPYMVSLENPRGQNFFILYTVNKLDLKTKLFAIALYAKKYSCYFIEVTLFESYMMQ